MKVPLHIDDGASLIARVEGAGEGSRNLDAAILHAIGRVWIPTYPPSGSWICKVGEEWIETSPGVMTTQDRYCPFFTGSLDGAMKLLDPSWFLHFSRFDPQAGLRGNAHVYPNRGLGDDYEADAATLPLAIVAAALKACLAQVDERPTG